MKLLRWALGLVVIIVVTAFALANRAPLTLKFDPLPWEIELPVYVLVLGSLGAGLLAGLLVEGLLGLRARALARSRARRIALLEAELAGLRRASPPALPPRPDED